MKQENSKSKYTFDLLLFLYIIGNMDRENYSYSNLDIWYILER